MPARSRAYPSLHRGPAPAIMTLPGSRHGTHAQNGATEMAGDRARNKERKRYEKQIAKKAKIEAKRAKAKPEKAVTKSGNH